MKSTRKTNNRVSRVFYALILAFLPATAYPQSFEPDYATGIGVRLGNTPGITVKKFLSEKGALEGILHVFRKGQYDGFLVTGLYEYHVQAFQVPGLNWYFGGGLHAGAFQYRDPDKVVSQEESDNNGVLYGADLIVGLEYRFAAIPITIGADFKPSISVPNNRLSALDGALNVRYVF